jgi:integral membrane protein (TIGR00529 family)
LILSFLNPWLVLLLSIAVILILIRLRVPVAFAIFAGAIFLVLFVTSFSDIPSLLFKTVTYSQTWELFIIVPCALAFSSFMEQKGMLTRLARTLENIGPRLAVHVLPAVIGLVPMPAGALVAATAVKNLADRLKLSADRITFINYWFRHIWEYSLPIYPSLIITATVLALPISTVVKILLPMSALAIILGGITSYRMLRKTTVTPREQRDPTVQIIVNSLKAAWPIILLIILVFVKVEAWIAFPSVLVLLAIQQRVNGREIIRAVKYGLSPLILLLLFSVMLYQVTITQSGAANVLVAEMQTLGLPSLLILAGIPLLLGVATGYGPATFGISMPLLLPFIITSSGLQWQALLVAFVSGSLGQMLSPAHLCFCLSAEYFKTTLGRVYRYTVPIIAVIEAVVIAIFMIIK